MKRSNRLPSRLSQGKAWLRNIAAAIWGTPPSQETLRHVLYTTAQRGTIDFDALRMIEGVLQVSEMPVSEIMVPRSEMITVPKEATLEDAVSISIQSGHSRFPVMGNSQDEVIGILLAKDLLNYAVEEERERFSLKEVLRPVIFVPDSKRLNVLLNEFRKNRMHLAIVVDEYGRVNGLITIEDVLEQIVGEIEDEYDIDKGIYIRKHKDNYSVKATTPIKEFNHFFHTCLNEEVFDTIGGLVSHAFGHLPKRGETILLEGIPFKVLRATNRRIQLLQTTLTPPASPDQQDPP